MAAIDGTVGLQRSMELIERHALGQSTGVPNPSFQGSTSSTAPRTLSKDCGPLKLWASLAVNHIAIVDSATTAFSQALSAFDLQPGDRILTTTPYEYASHQLSYLALRARRVVELLCCDHDAVSGAIDLTDLCRKLSDPRCKLVTLCWSPPHCGVRVSPHYYNTDTELDTCVATRQQLLRGQRKCVM